MGLLGAMAGAGSGMQDYATTLKEKEKADWVAQQEQVKHERAMNIQKLQEAGLDKRQGALLGHQATQGDLNRAGQLKQIDATAANTMALQGLRGSQEVNLQDRAIAGQKDMLATKTSLERELAQESNAIKREEIQARIDMLDTELRGKGKLQTQAEGARLTEIERTGEVQKDVYGEKVSKEIEATKQKFIDEFDARADATTQLLDKVYKTEGYKTASDPLKNAIELQVLVNGKLDFKDLANSPGVGPDGKKLEGITKGQMELSLNELSKSPVFSRMDAAQQWNMAQTRALILANPTLANSTLGTKVIAKENLPQAAKAWNEGKLDGLEILKMTPDTLAQVVDMANDMKALPVQPDRKAPAGGMLQGSRDPEYMSPETTSGVKGRQLAEWVNKTMSRDPLKLMAGDDEISDLQRASALPDL